MRIAVRNRVVVVNDGHVSAAAGGGGIDSDAGDEVIHGAVQGVDGNPGGGGPSLAVGGRADHDVIFGAVGAEAAVLPHHINIARAVDLSRGQGQAAQATAFGVAVDQGNLHGGVPTGSAICRSESADSGITLGKRNDDSAIGLDERLAAEAVG